MSQFVIRELKEITSVPHGFDEKILLQIQENLAVDVLRIHKEDFLDLARRQSAAGKKPEEEEHERTMFFAQMLQNEYRNRAINNKGFSLPLYIEAAENFYRLEIGRHLLAVKTYVALAKNVAETHHINSALEIRRSDPGVSDMANRVADSLNSLTDSLDKLARVKNQAAQAVTLKLRQEISTTIEEMHGDRFSQSLLAEAANLAAGKRYLAKLEQEPESSLNKVAMH